MLEQPGMKCNRPQRRNKGKEPAGMRRIYVGKRKQRNLLYTDLRMSDE
jgi:hypothetical protein